MASFDGGAFDPLAFDAAAFDLEDTPGALYGSAAGSSTASATLTAVAWIAGNAAGSSTAQGYLELDGGAVPPEPTYDGGGGGGLAILYGRNRPRWQKPVQPVRPVEDEEALLLLGMI